MNRCTWHKYCAKIMHNNNESVKWNLIARSSFFNNVLEYLRTQPNEFISKFLNYKYILICTCISILSGE